MVSLLVFLKKKITLESLILSRPPFLKMIINYHDLWILTLNCEHKQSPLLNPSIYGMQMQHMQYNLRIYIHISYCTSSKLLEIDQ